MYCPELLGLAGFMTGLAIEEIKLFGPVHDHPNALVAPALKLILSFSHTIPAGEAVADTALVCTTLTVVTAIRGHVVPVLTIYGSSTVTE
jgi:hypothetical protein